MHRLVVVVLALAASLAHAIASATAKQHAAERQQSDLFFAAMKRVLDREEPGWSALG